MKHAIRLIMLSLIAYAGMAHAGRPADEPLIMREEATMQRPARIDIATYAGRPNDAVALKALRSEGEAEFAVMTVQPGESVAEFGAYNGRPMDNPIR